ncbi:GNAT family acetyltransferase [Pseudalgibacter alginicilyticus]|uniref:GNAT family acetyltransferase n=1 Tax=Pseudalgibacter alginicilyticus TaxID=1736674 RepID=A0A0P0CJA1_9FLAO|nr:GNAT family N-acetyltransferase [Pseudalgibacter alginicilyticus]ALJ06301.1 GNAT family acetyltransferase [Pseudalgibacter alginicilyticus]
MLTIISVREQIQYKDIAITYLQESWPSMSPKIYTDCISHCIGAEYILPQWYLLLLDNEVIGCAGLISNDFISRMDLTPWLCALYIDTNYRGHNYAKLLIDKAKKDTKTFGFKYINLCTDLEGYYEKHGFEHIGQGYHPWDEESRIYQILV